jgi:hypothetical protein
MGKNPILSPSNQDHAMAAELVGITPFVDRLYQRQKGNGDIRGGFYPVDCTIEEFSAAAAGNPDLKRHDTVVKRHDNGSLVGVPYYTEYKDDLEAIALHLKNASRQCHYPAFRKYLELRAASLLSGNDVDCDIAWVNALDSPVEVIVGPMENYLDRFMGLKCSYESCVLIKDRTADNRLSGFIDARNRLPDALPLLQRGNTVRDPRIIVGNTLAIGGEMKDIKVRGCSLPNNPHVRDTYGVKLTLFKDVIEEQVNGIILPMIACIFGKDLTEVIAHHISVGYLSLIMTHEICHNTGLFPGDLERLGKTNISLEECKATVLGTLCAAQRKNNDASRDELMGLLLGLIGFALMNIRLAQTIPAREPYRTSDSIILNRIIDSGVVFKKDRWVIDIETSFQNLQQLAQDILLLKYGGTSDDALDFIKINAHFESIEPLLNAIKKVTVNL